MDLALNEFLNELEEREERESYHRPMMIMPIENLHVTPL